MPVTWNPSDKHSAISLTGGDLIATNISGSTVRPPVRATLSRSTGKYYFEVVLTTWVAQAGLMLGSSSMTGDNALGFLANCYGVGEDYSGGDWRALFNNVATQAWEDSGETYPFTCMVAADFDAGKVWFGVNGTWLRDRDPSLQPTPDPAAGTYAAFTSLSGTYFPAFSASENNRPNSGTAHFKLADMTYTPPSGFSAWDDATPGVGSASGTSTVTGVGINIGSGASNGTSTVSGVGIAIGVGAASGSSSVNGEGKAIVVAQGASSGASTVLGHPPITPNYRTGTAGEGATVTFNVNGGSFSAAAAPINDDVLYGGAAAYNDYSHASNVTQLKFTWATPRWIAGAVIYSSDALAGLSVEPTTETYTGANTAGQHGQDNSAWHIEDAAGLTVDAPQIGANNLVKQVRWLVSPIYTDTLFIEGLQGRIYEAQAVGTSSSPIAEVFETLNLSATIELRRTLTLSSTLGLVAALSGDETQTESSTLNLASVAVASMVHTETLSSTLDVTAVVESALTLGLASTVNFAATAIPASVALELVSTLALASPVTGIATRSAALDSSLVLGSLVVDGHEIELVSTANLVSSISGIRHDTVELASVMDLAGTAAATLHASTQLVSAFNLESSGLWTQVAQQVLESSVNLEAFIVLPYGSRTALWCNPLSTAAATWDGAPFESMVESDGAVYAAGDAGIYRMAAGEDDNGEQIAAYVMWDLLDFGDPKKHRPGYVVIGGYAAAPLKVRVTNEQGSFDCLTHLPANTKATNLRAKLGKGLNSRYNRFTVLNTGGKDFGFNDGAVEIVQLSRHIGGKHA